ncbi:MAG: hypothetical protein ACE5IY_09075 [bacterium]
MNNDVNYEISSIDWNGRGYCGFPEPPSDFRSRFGTPTEVWHSWLTALFRAKCGSFDLLGEFPQVYKKIEHPILQELFATLLGDASPNSCFQAVIDELETTSSTELSMDFCDVLQSRGRLADVPILLKVYQKIAFVEDADIIPSYLSRLLEPKVDRLSNPSCFASFNDYCDEVMGFYNRLVDRFGTENILIFVGEQFSVNCLAKRILDEVRNPYFQSFLRRKFEASTGVDCTNFYKAGVLQPLTAAAIVEEFLESPDAQKYEHGVRYFWGHRIPDE